MIDKSKLEAAAHDLIGNAEVIGDPRYVGATDCYAVPLDDIEALREALATTSTKPAKEAANSDSARLDWLEAAMAGDHKSTPYHDGNGFGFPYLVHGSPMGGGVGFRGCDSLRVAIDTAREVEAGEQSEASRGAAQGRITQDESAISAATSASASPAAPGFVMVPPRMTPEMARAAGDMSDRQYADLLAASPAAAVAAPAPAPVAGSQQIETTDDAREYLTRWMLANFPTDKTFSYYISQTLAGDFAYQLAHALAAAAPAVPVPAEQGWISIAERLPELYVAVALLNEDRWMNTGCDADINWQAAGWLCEHSFKYWSVIGETRSVTLESVTHWMPLPAAPSLQQPKEGSQP